MFCGLDAAGVHERARAPALRAELGSRTLVQAPFSPTRKLYQDTAWQANDPLVHYLAQDLLDPQNRPDDPNRTNTVRFAVPPTAVLTNSNLGCRERAVCALGRQSQPHPAAAGLRPPREGPLHHPRSDDWQFPTNKFPNLGWIGRVHRGTPWQTVYLKSGVISAARMACLGGQPRHPSDQ